MLFRNFNQFELTDAQKKKYGKNCTYVAHDGHWVVQQKMKGAEDAPPVLNSRNVLIPTALRHVFEDGISGELRYADSVKNENETGTVKTYTPTFLDGLMKSFKFDVPSSNPELNYYLQNAMFCANGEMKEDAKNQLISSGIGSPILYKLDKPDEEAEVITKSQLAKSAVILKISKELSEAQLFQLQSKLEDMSIFGRKKPGMTAKEVRASLMQLADKFYKEIEQVLPTISEAQANMINLAIEKKVLTYNIQEKAWTYKNAQKKEVVLLKSDTDSLAVLNAHLTSSPEDVTKLTNLIN